MPSPFAQGGSVPTATNRQGQRRLRDIHFLLQKGAVLSPNLRAHLEDAMHANEIDRGHPGTN
jgi:hypothetical protein